MTKLCACGKEFHTENKYCSQSCAATYTNLNRGKHSEDRKIKIAKSVCKFHGVEYTQKPKRNPDKTSIKKFVKVVI